MSNREQTLSILKLIHKPTFQAFLTFLIIMFVFGQLIWESIQDMTCVYVYAKDGWQEFRFTGTFTKTKTYTKIKSIKGRWSTDSEKYSPFGPAGYNGNPGFDDRDRYNRNFTFGALLAEYGSGYVSLEKPQQLPKPINEINMRINDANRALGNNEGNIQVCFTN